jgi:hypothetical protein
MNKVLFKESLKGLKIIGLVVLALAVILGIWLGVAWTIGWAMGRIFDLGNCGFSPTQYISFGSCILVFMLITQIITLSVTVWFLISWGKARVQKIIPTKEK